MRSIWDLTTLTQCKVSTISAVLYHEQGKYKLAEPLLQRALNISEQRFGI